MSSDRFLLAFAGAAQGLAFWALVELWPEADARGIAVCLALATFLSVSALVWHFAWTGADRLLLLLLALGAATLYAGVALWVGWQLPGPDAAFHGDRTRAFTWILGAGVSLFALGPFLQIQQRTRALHFPYTELFVHSWNNLFVAAIAASFLAALWTVLWLWGALFRLVEIEWFSDLFAKPLFAWVASGAATGLGITLGRESERVVETLRRIVLTAHQLLLPLVSFVGALFLAALPFTGLGPLWERDYASGLVLGWVTLHVLFLNAAFQDGRETAPGSRGLAGLVSAGVLTLPAYAAIAVYGLGLRIEQHGLTPTRFWGALLALVALGVALGYALGVLRPRRGWLSTLPTTNRALAFVVVSLGLATHTPLLDPLLWSARHQLSRAIEARVPAAEFDYGVLRFELGRAGDRALAELERLPSHPELAELRAGVARARAAKNAREWAQHRGPGLRAEDLVVRSPEAKLPAGLLDAIRAGSSPYEWQGCRNGSRCVALPVELDERAGAEWLVQFGDRAWDTLEVYAERDGAWQREGRLVTAGPDPARDAALRSGSIEPVMPLWRDLLIGDRRYRVDESR